MPNRSMKAGEVVFYVAALIGGLLAVFLTVYNLIDHTSDKRYNDLMRFGGICMFCMHGCFSLQCCTPPVEKQWHKSISYDGMGECLLFH